MGPNPHDFAPTLFWLLAAALQLLLSVWDRNTMGPRWLCLAWPRARRVSIQRLDGDSRVRERTIPCLRRRGHHPCSGTGEGHCSALGTGRWLSQVVAAAANIGSHQTLSYGSALTPLLWISAFRKPVLGNFKAHLANLAKMMVVNHQGFAFGQILVCLPAKPTEVCQVRRRRLNDQLGVVGKNLACFLQIGPPSAATANASQKHQKTANNRSMPQKCPKENKTYRNLRLGGE